MKKSAQAAIRPEKAEDIAAIFAVNQQAFKRQDEARLVNVLREQVSPLLSLVAVVDKAVVGHILFSPVHVENARRAPQLMLGLAPMAVLPEHQSKGIGSLLVRRGLDACRAAGSGAVVVLGHPEYYPRFGFVPAVQFNLRCEYPVPDNVFMAIELMPCSLDGCQGTVKYHPAFAGV
ncbi:MAG: N-acetyltransferase [Candidatus Hydrogenedentes bacterium]|nr:N-acetyltransferase [Candidatus Hydrogenedentota bacterium]